MTRNQWWMASLFLIAHKLWLPTLLYERLFSGNFPFEQMFGIFHLKRLQYTVVPQVTGFPTHNLSDFWDTYRIT